MLKWSASQPACISIKRLGGKVESHSHEIKHSRSRFSSHSVFNLSKSCWSITAVINCLFLQRLFLCCLFSGMTAVICTYPLDVIRARLAFQVTGEHRYTGIANAFHTIYLKVACWRSASQANNTVFTNFHSLSILLMFLFFCTGGGCLGLL